MAENDASLREQIGRLQSAQAVDPTENVVEYVRSAVRRLDDLAAAQSLGMRREMDLRAQHQRELAAAEKERLDAIRSIDAQAISLASQQVASVAQGLETKINNLAESQRQQLASMATLLQDRLSSVERNQYTGQGIKAQQVEGREQNNWLVGVLVASLVGVLGLIVGAIGLVIALTP